MNFLLIGPRGSASTVVTSKLRRVLDNSIVVLFAAKGNLYPMHPVICLTFFPTGPIIEGIAKETRYNMTKRQLLDRIKKQPLLMDGSTGTQLAQRGMPAGVSTHGWILEHPQIFLEMQKAYIDAGSQLLLSPNFGANRPKLHAHDPQADVSVVNQQLVALTRQAAAQGTDVLVAGDMGPTGLWMAPMGDTTFEQFVEIYAEQARAMMQTGVDLFVLETFMDIAEIRAAIFGIRSVSDVPIAASMTFEQGRTLTGATPAAVAIALVAAGADIVGANCSSGPDEMEYVLEQMAEHVDVPLFAKPNAGIPFVQDGETCFPLQAEAFAAQCKGLLQAGAAMIGGCCGTGPAHIAALGKIIRTAKTEQRRTIKAGITNGRGVQKLWAQMPLTIISGEADTKRNAGQLTALQQGEVFDLLDVLMDQMDAGHPFLKLCCDGPGVDAGDAVCQLTEQLASSQMFLYLEIADAQQARHALAHYQGRALLGSITDTPAGMELLDAAAAYGAAVVLTPVSQLLPDRTPLQRMVIIDRLLEKCRQKGIGTESVVIDCMIRSAKTDPDGIRTAAEFASLCHARGLITLAHLHDISQDLPKNELIELAYLPMLGITGLNLLVIDQNAEQVKQITDAVNVLTGRDVAGVQYISKYRQS